MRCNLIKTDLGKYSMTYASMSILINHNLINNEQFNKVTDKIALKRGGVKVLHYNYHRYI